MKSRDSFFKKNLLFIFLFFFMEKALAASSGGIPVHFVFFQALNFSLFLLILWRFILKKAPAFISLKHKDYFLMKEKAQNLYEKSKEEFEDVKQKLFEIEEREKSFDKELQEEFIYIEKKLSEELKLQKKSFEKSFQSSINQERMKFKEILKNDLLREVENLCLEKSQGKSQNLDLFSQKISQKQRLKYV